MAMKLNPYLSFRGDCREAMEFYADVLGGKLEMHTFGEYGADDPATADQIMHASLHTESGFTLMASDTPPGAPPAAQGEAIAVSLSGDEDTLRTYWERLSEGGTVSMPFEKQMWGDEFGMCTDRFGIPWMVNLAGSPA